jgi:hypothetical protein
MITSNASAILASLSSILKADYRGIIPYCAKTVHLERLISLDTSYMADHTIRTSASFLQNFFVKRSSLKVTRFPSQLPLFPILDSVSL